MLKQILFLGMMVLILILVPDSLVEASCQGQESLNNPVDLLQDLSLSRKTLRTTTAYSCILGGSLLLGVAVFDDSSSQDAAVFQAGLGVLGTIGILGGSSLLKRRFQAEEEYKRVLEYVEPHEREEEAALSVSRLAWRARRNRLLTGTLFALLAMGPITQVLEGGELRGDDPILLVRALASIGLAAYRFFVPSQAEKKHQLLTEPR